MLLPEAELRVLGYDQQRIAEALLRLWKYPGNLIQAVAYHHHPVSIGTASLEAAVVHVSDHLVNAMQIGSSGERYVPPLNMKAWTALHLSQDLLPSLVARIDEQIEAVQEVFLSRITEA